MYSIEFNNSDMESIKCFTDASYSKDISLCVIGYMVGDSKVSIEYIPDMKNTQGELHAIDRCIEKCNQLHPDSQMEIYTDCSRALKNDYGDEVTIVKIKGHLKKALRTENDNLFRKVDRAVRKALRKRVKELS